MRHRSSLLLIPLLALPACSREEPILNRKPDVELCRRDPGIQTFKIDAWDKGAATVDIHFLPHGTTPCPGRKFPFIDVAPRPATPESPPLRVIQIVEVNEPIPGGLRDKPSWQILAEDQPWMFVDMVEELRDKGEPFINANPDGKFWDNPTWPDPPKEGHSGGSRKWQSRTYAVQAAGRAVTAVAGFSWGWSWAVGGSGPEPVAPEQLPRSAWEQDAKRLTGVFEGWTFK